MLDFPEPYLLAPSSLTPTALRERAEALLTVTDPTVFENLPTGSAIELRGNFLYDAWLVKLGPDAASDLHAHERGFGTVAVVSGALRETRASRDGLDERVVAAGDMVGTRPGDTHRLTVEGEGAVAVYLASPPRGAAPRIVTSTSAVPVVPAAAV
ncbi:cupin domain-containing protein [Cryptosporangium aurantiacum]|uniref:Cysteine dioxygenase type I n=1 Tax=Cryptosporangium aurantiacum TaxID=134849 RepID=A0A1M7REW9_9ACTN|nr:cupin domain-containing protein [Cryptosporangium aurantiacum]SHN44568.1 Cysteine dioxygenase type I [Cryptosporangium aurantiacum]